MTRDPRETPERGDIVCAPRSKVSRQVTRVHKGELHTTIFYIRQREGGSQRKESTYLREWRDWCKKHNAEVALASGQ